MFAPCTVQKSPQIVQNTFKAAQSEEFILRHKTRESAFTRNRKLPFFSLLLFLLNQVKGSLQDELDAFMQQGNLTKTAEQTVSKAAFTKARQQLRPSAFIELNTILLQNFYQEHTRRTWHGFRLCAIDGSKVTLPNTAEMLAKFGGRKNMYTTKPLATLSQCYDVLNELSLDIEVGPCDSCERKLAYSHLQKVPGNSLFLYDRGYPAFWLMAAHNVRRQKFCIRMPIGSKFDYVNDFLRSENSDTTVEIEATRGILTQCNAYGIEAKTLKLRLIKIILSTGEVEVLATNLFDEKNYPHSEFKALYHLRWRIEEDYKQQKHSLKIELFSGKSVHSVLQDIHAKALAKNITRLISLGAESKVAKINERRKLSYKINFKQALSKTKFILLKIFTTPNPTKWIKRLIGQLIRYLEPVRPSRHYPRKRAVGTRGAVSSTYKPTR